MAARSAVGLHEASETELDPRSQRGLSKGLRFRRDRLSSAGRPEVPKWEAGGWGAETERMVEGPGYAQSQPSAPP